MVTIIPAIGANIFAVHVRGMKCAISVVNVVTVDGVIVYLISDVFMLPLIVTLKASTRAEILRILHFDIST